MSVSWTDSSSRSSNHPLGEISQLIKLCSDPIAWRPKEWIVGIRCVFFFSSAEQLKHIIHNPSSTVKISQLMFLFLLLFEKSTMLNGIDVWYVHTCTHWHQYVLWNVRIILRSSPSFLSLFNCFHICFTGWGNDIYLAEIRDKWLPLSLLCVIMSICCVYFSLRIVRFLWTSSLYWLVTVKVSQFNSWRL